jgi:hypothetical protein
MITALLRPLAHQASNSVPEEKDKPVATTKSSLASIQALENTVYQASVRSIHAFCLRFRLCHLALEWKKIL